MVQSYAYDSFGKPNIVTGSGTITSIDNVNNLYGNTRLYTGREYDREIKLYFLRARYYDASTGRFISRDPIGQRDQINLYTYVGNSPLVYVDRDGKYSKSFIKQHDATELLKVDMENGKNEYLLGLIKETARRNGYNTKYRDDYRNLSFDPETKESCAWEYSSDCVVYINWKVTVTLPQIGNFLIGYNFNYAWFTLNAQYWQATNDIYQAGLFTEDVGKRLNFFQDPDLYNQAVQNELLDRPYYDAWFQYAKHERMGYEIILISDYLNF